MMDFIAMIFIGLLVIIIGISNMKGNISLLHSYHRKRVKKEDIIPFCKTIGIGAIIIGCTIVVMGIFSLFEGQIISFISNLVLAVGLIPGFIIIFYALFKYNKGIF